jgi:hypothetical protein
MSIALELLGIAEQAAAYHGTSAAPETSAKEGVVDSLRIAGRVQRSDRHIGTLRAP